MPQINLLPNEFIIDRRANTRKWIIKGVIVASVTGLVYTYAMFLNQYWSLKSQLATTQLELTGYQPLLAQYHALQSKQQAAAQVKNFVQQEKQSRIIWSELLTQLQLKCGPGIRLADISLGKDDLVQIFGQAAAFSQVGDLYAQLKQIPSLQNLSIEVINRSRNSGQSSPVQFKLTGKLQRGGTTNEKAN